MREYSVGMNISVNWTAVSSICTALSCVIALALGVLSEVHSSKHEKRQRKREIRDKALDAAVQLATVYYRFLLAKDQEDKHSFMVQIASLCTALQAYGYPVDDRLLFSGPANRNAANEELDKLLDAIVSNSD